MCIVFVALDYSEEFPFILFFNRDEDPHRNTGSLDLRLCTSNYSIPPISISFPLSQENSSKTKMETLSKNRIPSNHLDESSLILSGLDNIQYGTWLGLNIENGNIAALTNLPFKKNKDLPLSPKSKRKLESRGHLIRDFLCFDDSNQLPPKIHDSEFDGFNLLFGNIYKHLCFNPFLNTRFDNKNQENETHSYDHHYRHCHHSDETHLEIEKLFHLTTNEKSSSQISQLEIIEKPSQSKYIPVSSGIHVFSNESIYFLETLPNKKVTSRHLPKIKWVQGEAKKLLENLFHPDFKQPITIELLLEKFGDMMSTELGCTISECPEYETSPFSDKFNKQDYPKLYDVFVKIRDLWHTVSQTMIIGKRTKEENSNGEVYYCERKTFPSHQPWKIIKISDGIIGYESDV